MKKEIKITFNKQEQAYTIRYYLHGDKATMQFVVRCPTEHWNYYLAIDIGYHADTPQYNEHNKMPTCECRAQGFCYYDGSSLNAERLWNEFKSSGDENIIWNELEQWYNERFV